MSCIIYIDENVAVAAREIWMVERAGELVKVYFEEPKGAMIHSYESEAEAKEAFKRITQAWEEYFAG